MFLLHAIHYPHPHKEELLIQSMRAFGELLKKQPGVTFVNVFKDAEKGTLVALIIWESEEAFQTSWPVLVEDAPPEVWEVKPREVSLLNSVF
jgi:heme-degrading monooxygenase HmoA